MSGANEPRPLASRRARKPQPPPDFALGKVDIFSGEIDIEAIQRRAALASAAFRALAQAQAQETKMPEPSAIETELRLQLAETRTDKKFADALGEMRTGFAELRGDTAVTRAEIRQTVTELRGGFADLGARVTSLERSMAGTKTTVIVTGVAIAALMLGVLAYGQIWFGIGVSTRDVVKAAVTEYREQTPPAITPAPANNSSTPAR